MMVLIRREKTDVIDADVAMSWMLQRATETMVGEREKES
jgi:hypothetical protein